MPKGKGKGKGKGKEASKAVEVQAELGESSQSASKAFVGPSSARASSHTYTNLYDSGASDRAAELSEQLEKLRQRPRTGKFNWEEHPERSLEHAKVWLHSFEGKIDAETFQKYKDVVESINPEQMQKDIPYKEGKVAELLKVNGEANWAWVKWFKENGGPDPDAAVTDNQLPDTYKLIVNQAEVELRKEDFGESAWRFITSGVLEAAPSI